MTNRVAPIIGAMGVVILGASLQGLQGQTPSPNIEQQLRSQYRITRVGTNGTVVGQPGSVLEVHADGLIAIPALYTAYWYNTLKKDGRIRPNALQHVGSRFHDAMADRRPFHLNPA